MRKLAPDAGAVWYRDPVGQLHDVRAAGRQLAAGDVCQGMEAPEVETLFAAAARKRIAAISRAYAKDPK